MRKFLRFLGVAAVLAAAAGPASAQDCKRPSNPPAVPDGAKATVEQFKAAHPLIQAYSQALSAYRDCLEDKIKQLPANAKADVRQKLRDEGSTALDESKTLSSAYMDQVKIFKTVGKGRSLGAN
ncbi:MAG TPA: hypothetical protein VH722_08530 [Alphaproteobacteria bacterium]|jgi:ABC-type transporter Mla subunit MlaD|nr:hypothetical protein [Alphaproteobacteria bacterium]